MGLPRKPQLFFALLLACVISAGCSSSRSRSPFAWLKRDANAEQADEKVAKRKDSPFKSSRDAARPKRDEATLADATHADIDVETREMIDQVIARTPVQQRGQLRKDLESLDPATLRMILRSGKLANQVGKPGQAATAQFENVEGRDQPFRVTSQATSQVTQQEIEYDPTGNDPLFPRLKPKATANANLLVSKQAEGLGSGFGDADPWARPHNMNRNPGMALPRTDEPISQSTPGLNSTSLNSPALNSTPNLSPSQELHSVQPSHQPHVQLQTPPSMPAQPAVHFPADYNPVQIGHGIQPLELNGTFIRPHDAGHSGGAGTVQPIPTHNYTPRGSYVAPQQTNYPNHNGVNPAISYQQQWPQPHGGNPYFSQQNIPVQYQTNYPTHHGIQQIQNLEVAPALAVPDSGQSVQSGGIPGAELQRLIAQAERDVATAQLGISEAEQHNYIQKHVNLRLLYLVSGRQERALEAIPGISAGDQEFWQQMFWAVANYFDVEAMPSVSERATQTVAQLRSAIARLQENARLQLRNVAFCHKIVSFGSYERFNRDEFTPGQPVLVYAEVANFRSEPNAEQQYRTILKSTIDIYRAGSNGELIERLEFPATEDLCRNQRRDYFHSYEFTIPKRISLGPHVMKLTVEDQLNRKVATYTLNFTVK